MRTSMGLEPEFWNALTRIAALEEKTVSQLVEIAERSAAGCDGRLAGSRTSAVRVFVMTYWRRLAEPTLVLLAGASR